LPLSPEITRRRLLASAGVGAAAVGFGGAGFLAGRESAEASSEGTGSVPFYGEHQAGIATSAQDRLHFAAFDLLTEDPEELRELMREFFERCRAEEDLHAEPLVVTGLIHPPATHE